MVPMGLVMEIVRDDCQLGKYKSMVCKSPWFYFIRRSVQGTRYFEYTLLLEVCCSYKYLWLLDVWICYICNYEVSLYGRGSEGISSVPRGKQHVYWLLTVTLNDCEHVIQLERDSFYAKSISGWSTKLSNKLFESSQKMHPNNIC